jgi:hypothetical protein
MWSMEIASGLLITLLDGDVYICIGFHQLDSIIFMLNLVVGSHTVALNCHDHMCLKLS